MILVIFFTVILPVNTEAFSVDLKPTDFVTGIEHVVKAGFGDADTNIPANLEEAMCGGWGWDLYANPDETDDPNHMENPKNSVAANGGTPKGKISEVTGLPGHDSVPLGSIESGMAVRTEDQSGYAAGSSFIAPGDVPTAGFMSACRPTATARAPIPPSFYDAQSACQRPLGGIDPDNVPDAGFAGRNPIQFSCGGRPYAFPVGYMPADGNVANVIDQSLDNGGLCDYLNTHWLYGYYEKKVWVDANCQEVAPDDENKLCQVTRSITSPELDGLIVKTVQDILGNITIPDPSGGAPYTCADIRYGCTHQSIDPSRAWGPNGPTGGGTTDCYSFGGTNDGSQQGNGRSTAGTGTPPPSPTPTPTPTPPPPLVPNCTICQGAECRWCNSASPADCTQPSQYPGVQWMPGPTGAWLYEYIDCWAAAQAQDPPLPAPPCAFPTPKRGDNYRSFYRYYTADAVRDEVKVEDDDKDSRELDDVPVSCYSLYSEYDTKKQPSFTSRNACVIAAYYPDEPAPAGNDPRRKKSFSKMQESQKILGKFLFSFPDIARAVVRYFLFSVDQSLWNGENSNAFSLTNSKVLKGRYNNDLTLVLYQPMDVAVLETTEQLTENQPISSGSLIRSFDDSVHAESQQLLPDIPVRPFTEWWQKIESKAHMLFNPPTIHMLIPPTWSLGFDVLNPIFIPPLLTPSSEPRLDPSSQAIDVQIQARDDLLGDVQKFLENNLFPQMQEEPIPVVVPLITLEVKANAEKWKKWAAAREHDGQTVPTNVQDLIQQFDAYALQAEEVRAMRGEVAKFSGELFEYHTQMTTGIAKWLNEDIIDHWKQFQVQLRAINQMKSTWESAQNTYRNMTDKASFPWCHNDRFTTPIYSLLDTWFPGRTNGMFSMELSSIPQLNDVNRGVDCKFDFTALKTIDKVLKMPVLDPILVKIQLIPAPDPEQENPGNVPVLPALPPVPTLARNSTELKAFFPNYRIGTKPKGLNRTSLRCELYQTPTLLNIANEFSKIHGYISRMKTEYETFWGSALAVATPASGSPPAEKSSLQDCYGKNTEACVHVEMDLKERLQRLTSRPAIFLVEDIDSQGGFRPNPADVGYGLASCDPSDWACQFLNKSDTYPIEGWELKWNGELDTPSSFYCAISSDGNLIDKKRVCAFNDTLYRDGVPEIPSTSGGQGQFPYGNSRNVISPSLGIPRDIHIQETGSLIPQPPPT